jgi:hypothetical protein
MRCTRIFRSVEWKFCTDVSRQPIGPIFKGEEVQDQVSTMRPEAVFAVHS